MAKAIWNNQVIANSNQTKIVEGNHYFPKESVDMKLLHETSLHTTCPWKGVASYYTVIIGNEKNENAAWFYPAPKEAASEIKDHIAFWKGVKIDS